MTDQELDRLMRRVLLDSLKREYASETVAVMPYKLSWRHHRQMDAMLKNPLKWLRNKTKPVWKIVVQRIAIVLLVTSLSLGGLMAISPTVRAAVIRWVTEWYETHITFRYTGDSIREDLLHFEICDLPDGYSEAEEERIEDAGYVQKKYRNNSDPTAKTIYLAYMNMQQGAAMDFVTEAVTVFQVEINGISGYLYLADDWQNTRSTVTWIDEEKNLQFVIDATMSKDDILHIADGVVLVKMAK